TKPPSRVKTVAPLVLKAGKVGKSSAGAVGKSAASGTASGTAGSAVARAVGAAARAAGAVGRGAAAKGITGNQYRDLIAGYIHHNYAPAGLDVYVEISLGKSVIGKDRCIDVFVVRPEDRKAVAIECKYQDSLGTVD